MLSCGLPDVSWAEEALPRQGPKETPKPRAGSSEAHTAALPPGSRTVTGAGSRSQRKGIPPGASQHCQRAKPRSQSRGIGGGSHVEPAVILGQTDTHTSCPGASPSTLLVGQHAQQQPTAPRTPWETSALQKPNHPQGLDLAYCVTRAGYREEKTSPHRTYRTCPNATISGRAAPFLPAKSPLPSKPQEPSAVAGSETLPEFMVEETSTEQYFRKLKKPFPNAC